MIVPTTLRISFLVMKKNSIPDRATRLHKMSRKNRFASPFHKCDGIKRRALIGFSDSSFMRAVNSDTANVRMMRKTNEYQK